MVFVIKLVHFNLKSLSVGFQDKFGSFCSECFALVFTVTVHRSPHFVCNDSFSVFMINLVFPYFGVL